MIRIGILGDIGSGKSYVARRFSHPTFDADLEVGKLYKRDKKIFLKLKKELPKYIHSFPIKKKEISSAILTNKNNLKKIVKIVHYEIRKKLKIFLDKNKKKRIVILDIPLLLENNLDEKDDILVFVQSKKVDVLKRLNKRKNFNLTLLKIFKNFQLSLEYKKKKSKFIIKNDFTKRTVTKYVNNILSETLK